MPAGIPVLTPRVEGSTHGETLFFVQGWPDDHTLWEAQVSVLRERYRCVRVDLPNFPGAEQRRWGFDHEAMAAGLAQCIREVSPDRPVTLIAHDWGAYWSYLLHHRNPALVSRFVGLDVAPRVEPRPREAALILAYQWWLVAAFVSGGTIGDWMTRRFAELAQTPRRGSAIAARLNYPYFYTWRDVLARRRRRLLQGYRPEVPVLYVYGADKPAQFHSEAWLEFVRSRPGNAVVGLAGVGHWVMRHPEFTGILRDWLGRS